MAEDPRSPERQAEANSIPPPAMPSLDTPVLSLHTPVPSAPAVRKVEAGGGGGGWYSWNGKRSEAPRSSRVVRGIVQRGHRAESVARAAIGIRVAAAVLCLVAFAVLAADRNKGWAVDDYRRYKQFRYCLSVNVIGFVYSGFQLCALVRRMMKEKQFMRRPLGDSLDFAMDQILAYLLISSSSAATARIDDWTSNWGSDPFPNMANGSVAVSFLAFLAFAVSSLISAYFLFSQAL